jgi:large subunit ribosomal protein L4
MIIKFLNLNNLNISEQKFDIEPEDLNANQDLIASVVKWQLANRRGFSSAKTKVRGEIAMTGKKPGAQKHRGTARQGSMKGAQFVGGAKAFGPKERDYSYKMPKKAVKKALFLVLKDYIANDKFFVIEGLQEVAISTNDLNKKLIKQGITTPLIALQEIADNFSKSVRNIKGVKLIRSNALNVCDLLKANFLLLDKAAFETIKEDLQ